MKRVFLLVLCVLFVMLPLPGCGCDHEYVSTVTKEPTYEADGEKTYACSKCYDIYTEPIEKLKKHIVPTSVLSTALYNVKYRSMILSISVGELVTSAMDNYEIEYLTGEEAIAQGYLAESDIGSSVNIDYLYYAIISGDTMLNPDIPYMTVYEKEAVKVWMLFDANDKLQNSGVTLCGNLQTCAISIMTSGY